MSIPVIRDEQVEVERIYNQIKRIGADLRTESEAESVGVSRLLVGLGLLVTADSGAAMPTGTKAPIMPGSDEEVHQAELVEATLALRTIFVPAETKRPIGYDLSTGPLAFWRLDDATDSVGSNDLSGNNITTEAAFLGNGATFDGLASKYTAAAADPMRMKTPGENFFSVWIKPTALADNVGIVEFGDNSTYSYSLQLHSDGSVSLSVNSGDATLTTDAGVLVVDRWHLVVCSIETLDDSVRMRVSVNNGVVASASHAALISEPAVPTLKIGVTGPEVFFTGQMDAAGFWYLGSDLLSDAQRNAFINGLWNAGQGLEV